LSPKNKKKFFKLQKLGFGDGQKVELCYDTRGFLRKPEWGKKRGLRGEEKPDGLGEGSARWACLRT